MLQQHRQAHGNKEFTFRVLHPQEGAQGLGCADPVLAAWLLLAEVRTGVRLKRWAADQGPEAPSWPECACHQAVDLGPPPLLCSLHASPTGMLSPDHESGI